MELNKPGVMIMVVVVVTMGTLTGTLYYTMSDADRHCEVRFGEGWSGAENVTEPNNALEMCEHENGTVEPIVFENATADPRYKNIA